MVDGEFDFLLLTSLGLKQSGSGILTAYCRMNQYKPTGYLLKLILMQYFDKI